MANELKYTSVFQQLSFGDFGFRILSTGETSVEGEYFGAVQMLNDSTIGFTNDVASGDTSISNLQLAAGQTVYGNITNLTITSGKVLAYIR
jgi:hypothetical protein